MNSQEQGHTWHPNKKGAIVLTLKTSNLWIHWLVGCFLFSCNSRPKSSPYNFIYLSTYKVSYITFIDTYIDQRWVQLLVLTLLYSPSSPLSFNALVSPSLFSASFLWSLFSLASGDYITLLITCFIGKDLIFDFALVYWLLFHLGYSWHFVF